MKLADGTPIRNYVYTAKCDLDKNLDFLIGSSPGAQIPIGDNTVEKEHTKISHVPGLGWVL